MLEAASPTLETLKEPVQQRLRRVEACLADMMPAGFEALDEVGEYLLESRGKLLRPTLLLLANEVGGSPSTQAYGLAAIVELMHLATLVHDDSVDHSVERRGMPTVNSRWSHQVAVIVGDYLYSRAVIEIARFESIDAIRILAESANQMTIGEMRQLLAYDALGFSQDDYFDLCGAKTASLMAAACELGAMVGQPVFREQLRLFGYNFGMVFQITDDLLDYTVTAEMMGKPAGADLREHKVTLPLIAALPEFDAAERGCVEQLFVETAPSDDLVERVIAAVKARGGIEFARLKAAEFADRARAGLDALPEGDGLQSLKLAVDYVLERQR
jgi:octaprenyl-diphosphate synthase